MHETCWLGRYLPATQAQKGPKRGVIYLGHVPFGFFEDQLRGFFAQFGDITNLKLSRNKKVCFG